MLCSRFARRAAQAGERIWAHATGFKEAEIPSMVSKVKWFEVGIPCPSALVAAQFLIFSTSSVTWAEEKDGSFYYGIPAVTKPSRKSISRGCDAIYSGAFASVRGHDVLERTSEVPQSRRFLCVPCRSAHRGSSPRHQNPQPQARERGRVRCAGCFVRVWRPNCMRVAYCMSAQESEEH